MCNKSGYIIRFTEGDTKTQKSKAFLQGQASEGLIRVLLLKKRKGDFMYKIISNVNLIRKLSGPLRP